MLTNRPFKLNYLGLKITDVSLYFIVCIINVFFVSRLFGGVWRGNVIHRDLIVRDHHVRLSIIGLDRPMFLSKRLSAALGHGISLNRGLLYLTSLNPAKNLSL